MNSVGEWSDQGDWAMTMTTDSALSAEQRQKLWDEMEGEGGGGGLSAGDIVGIITGIFAFFFLVGFGYFLWKRRQPPPPPPVYGAEDAYKPGAGATA